jgi:hypothetical protein
MHWSWIGTTATSGLAPVLTLGAGLAHALAGAIMGSRLLDGAKPVCGAGRIDRRFHVLDRVNDIRPALRRVPGGDGNAACGRVVISGFSVLRCAIRVPGGRLGVAPGFGGRWWAAVFGRRGSRLAPSELALISWRSCYAVATPSRERLSPSVEQGCNQQHSRSSAPNQSPSADRPAITLNARRGEVAQRRRRKGPSRLRPLRGRSLK